MIVVYYHDWLCWGTECLMIVWWFLVHSYCWTCGFQGPLGAQGAVGCPLATTQVNHFLRGLFDVDFLGVDFLGVDFGLKHFLVWIC